MSLILDALNRADEERKQRELTPSLRSTPTAPAENHKTFNRWTIQALAILLLFTLVLYTLFFRSPPELTQTNSNDPVPLPNPRPNSQNTAKKNIELPSTTSPPAKSISSREAAALYVREALRPNNVGSKAETRTASAPQSAISQLYQQQNQREAAQQEVLTDAAITTQPAAEQVVSAEPVKPSVSKQPDVDPIAFFQQVPMLSDMPTRFKRTVPSLEYKVHVYSSDNQSGVVNLNGPYRKVGSQVAPGLRIVAILPDSVVLELDGVLFRLKAMTSWVGY